MAETLTIGDLVWISGSFKCVTYTDHEGKTQHKIKVKTDRCFLVNSENDSEESKTD